MGTFLEDMNRRLRAKEEELNKKPMGFAQAAAGIDYRDIHLGDSEHNSNDSRNIGNIWDFGAPQIASTNWVKNSEGNYYDVNPDYVAGALPHGRPRETIGKTYDEYYGNPEAKHDIARAGKNYINVDDYWDRIMYPVASVHDWNNDLGVDGDPNRETSWGLPAWDRDVYYARKRANTPTWWKGRNY
jgi:hypothetical protein